MPPKPLKAKLALKLEHVAYAVGSVRRWRIFEELAKGEPLPVSEIARRVGFAPNAASKILIRLEKTGLLECPFGLYRLPANFLMPGESALDFGRIILRLERPHSANKE